MTCYSCIQGLNARFNRSKERVTLVNQDLSVPTIFRNAQRFEDLPAHLQQRASSIAQKQFDVELLAKHVEDKTAAMQARRNELDVMKTQLEALKSDLRNECRRHITNT